MKSEKTLLVSIIVTIAIYTVVFSYFDYLFGETPVNILELGSRDGSKNLMINLASYAVITSLITILISLFVPNKLRWLTGIFLGSIISIVITYIYVMAYFLGSNLSI